MGKAARYCLKDVSGEFLLEVVVNNGRSNKTSGTILSKLVSKGFQPSFVTFVRKSLVGISLPTPTHHAGSKASSNRSGMNSKDPPGYFAMAAWISFVRSLSYENQPSVFQNQNASRTHLGESTAYFDIAYSWLSVPHSSFSISGMSFSSLHGFRSRSPRGEIRFGDQVKENGRARSTRESNYQRTCSLKGFTTRSVCPWVHRRFQRLFESGLHERKETRSM